MQDNTTDKLDSGALVKVAVPAQYGVQ